MIRASPRDATSRCVRIYFFGTPSWIRLLDAREELGLLEPQSPTATTTSADDVKKDSFPSWRAIGNASHKVGTYVTGAPTPFWYALAIMMLLIVPAGDPVRRIRFIAAVIAFLLTLGHVFISSGVTRAIRKEKYVASLVGMAHWGGRFLKIGITLPFGAAAYVMLGPPEQTVWLDVFVCTPMVLIGLAFLFLQAALEGGRNYARYGR